MNSKVRESRVTALMSGIQSWVLWGWVIFWVVSGQSLRFRVLPRGMCVTHQDGSLVRRTLGGGRAHSTSFWPFLNSSTGWLLISSMVLTRTSCFKITHINGQWCHARVGSFSVYHLTAKPWGTQDTYWELGQRTRPVGYRHQFSSVAQSCLTLYNSMNRSMPGFPVHHQLLEFTETQSWLTEQKSPTWHQSSYSVPEISKSETWNL